MTITYNTSKAMDSLQMLKLVISTNSITKICAHDCALSEKNGMYNSR